MGRRRLKAWKRSRRIRAEWSREVSRLRLVDRLVWEPWMRPRSPGVTSGGGKPLWLVLAVWLVKLASRFPPVSRSLARWKGPQGILFRRRLAVRCLSLVLLLGLRTWSARYSNPYCRKSKN